MKKTWQFGSIFSHLEDFISHIRRCGVSSVYVLVHLYQASGLPLSGQQSTMGCGVVFSVSGFTSEQDLQRLREKMDKNRRNKNQEMVCRVTLLTSLDCLDPDVPKQE